MKKRRLGGERLGPRAFMYSTAEVTITVRHKINSKISFPLLKLNDGLSNNILLIDRLQYIHTLRTSNDRPLALPDQCIDHLLPSRQQLCDFCPSVPQSLVCLVNNSVFLFCPGGFLNFWIQVVMPPLPTLFPDPPF